MIRHGDKVTYRIIVNRLERRDSGTYRCQIVVTGSSQSPTKDGKMIVLSKSVSLLGNDNNNDNDFIHFLNMRHRKYIVIQCYIYSMCIIQQCWLNT